jgi:hypothetical protein
MSKKQKDENEMVDQVWACLLCGELMENLTPRQLKLFGKPKCCESKMMIPFDRNDLFKIVKGLEVLKTKMEAEIIRGMV